MFKQGTNKLQNILYEVGVSVIIHFELYMSIHGHKLADAYVSENFTDDPIDSHNVTSVLKNQNNASVVPLFLHVHSYMSRGHSSMNDNNKVLLGNFNFLF